MKRLDKERQLKLEPKIINVAIEKIKGFGLEVISTDDTCVKFIFKGNVISFYPYSGWHTGKGINDGRGANNLWIQLKS